MSSTNGAGSSSETLPDTPDPDRNLTVRPRDAFSPTDAEIAVLDRLLQTFARASQASAPSSNRIFHSSETPEIANGRHDRVFAVDGSFIQLNSHIEDVARVLDEIIRSPKPLVGPAFDGTAFQAAEPVMLERFTELDKYVRDMDFGLWHLTPRMMHPIPPSANLEMLSLDKIAAALRTCRDEYQLELQFYVLRKVIDTANLEYEDSNWNVNLECGICRMPLLEPETLHCDHTFCAECIRRALSIRFECPECRTAVRPEFSRPPRFVLNLLNEIKVRCPLRDRGCEQIMSRSDVSKHVMHHCGYLLVACPSSYHGDTLHLPRCTILLPRKDLRWETCRHMMIECELCGLFSCPEINMADHMENQCPAYMMACKHCSAQVPRKAFDSHVKECEKEVRSCRAGPFGCGFEGSAVAYRQHELTCIGVKLLRRVDEQAAALETQQETMKLWIENHKEFQSILRSNRLLDG